VEYAILALSACRSFTYRTFGYLGQRLDFGHQRSDFEKLIAFSFISPATSGSDDREGAAQTYSMHQLLRRALGSARPDSVQRAHQVLEERYRELAASGDFTAQLEQIYHAGQLFGGASRTGDRAVASVAADTCAGSPRPRLGGQAAAAAARVSRSFGIGTCTSRG
jgi:hypothetical protein